MLTASFPVKASESVCTRDSRSIGTPIGRIPYWKNPGDAGAPPEIELTLPQGATAGDIAWPGPDGIPVGPVKNFGYENEIVLPIAVTVPQSLHAGDSFSIQAEANWLVCEQECVPESGRFRLDLPVSATATPAGDSVAAAFGATDARMPIPSPWSSILTDEGPKACSDG